MNSSYHILQHLPKPFIFFFCIQNGVAVGIDSSLGAESHRIIVCFFPFSLTTSHKRRNLGSERPYFRDREDGNPTGGHPVPQELCLHHFHTHSRKGKAERPLHIWQCNKASERSSYSFCNTDYQTRFEFQDNFQTDRCNLSQKIRHCGEQN